MTRKDFERAARVVQAYSSDAKEANRLADVFVSFFKGTNERFDEERFRRACLPGANVKARG